MDKKIKILLICLGIVSLLVVGLAAWIYFSAQVEVAEYAKKQTDLEKQNTYLQKKLDSSLKETRHWREKSESITAALNKLSKEHALVLSQYDSLSKEKDSLIGQSKTLSEQLEKLEKLYSQVQEKAEISTSDKFLASLLEEKARLEVEVENLKSKISSQEAQLEDIERRTRPTREKFAWLEKEKETLEKGLADVQKVSNILSNDLLQEKKKKFALEKDLTKTEEQLRDIMQERDSFSAQLAKMKQALEQRLAELNRTKKILESAVEGAEKVVSKTELPSIQLPPIVVKVEPDVPSLPRKLSKAKIIEEETFELTGRIITVNNKHGFVVIDIGRDNGVKKGMSFDVYRKDKKVGKVEVIETRKDIAACDIREVNVRHLKLNDTVHR